MAETSIEWTSGPNGEVGYTFNPWIGCQRVSPGCEHCYAEAYDKRVGGVPVSQRQHAAAMISLGHALKPGEQLLRWGPRAPRTRTSPSYWKQPMKWNAEAQAAGQRRKVFCASLADVFEDRPELVEWRAQLLDLIVRTTWLDWLLLTKRPENIISTLRKSLAFLEANRGAHCDAAIALRLWLNGVGNDDVPYPPSNVWLGTTVEDRERLSRLDHLRRVPARVRFISGEPLLEDLGTFDLTGIDWVICGGESGPGARPFDIAWARSLRDQCRAAGVAFFMKQLGARPYDSDRLVGTHSPHDKRTPMKPDGAGGLMDMGNLVLLKDRAGGDPAEWPVDLRVREFPNPKGATP